MSVAAERPLRPEQSEALSYADPDSASASFRATRVLSDGILSVTIQDTMIDLDVTQLPRT